MDLDRRFIGDGEHVGGASKGEPLLRVPANTVDGPRHNKLRHRFSHGVVHGHHHNEAGSWKVCVRCREEDDGRPRSPSSSGESEQIGNAPSTAGTCRFAGYLRARYGNDRDTVGDRVPLRALRINEQRQLAFSCLERHCSNQAPHEPTKPSIVGPASAVHEDSSSHQRILRRLSPGPRR